MNLIQATNRHAPCSDVCSLGPVAFDCFVLSSWTCGSKESRRPSALASIERDQLADEETDVEGLLDFAVHMLASAERMWTQFNPHQKRQFQRLLFPEGLPFNGSAFGTAKTSPVFSYMHSVSATESRMASPGGFEPPLPA